MKQQIAGFLGELAEELGWTPDLEDARVKEETSRPATPATTDRPRALTPDPEDTANLTTPVERLRAELDQLRSTVKHLGSEVIYLRGQLAKMRNLPVPPDAGESGPVTVDTAPAPVTVAQPEVTPPSEAVLPVRDVADIDRAASQIRSGAAPETTEPESAEAETAEPGRWPRLFRRTTVHEGSSGTRPATGTDDAVPREPGSEGPKVPEPTEAHAAIPPVSAEAQEPATESEAPGTPAEVTPTVVDVDEDTDSALELFPSEPARRQSADPV